MSTSSPQLRNLHRLFAAISVLALGACGGGGSNSAPPPPVPAPSPGPVPPISAPTSPPPGPAPAPAPAPGGLYVGYYAEDQATNPEDAVPGALYFSLPEQNVSFGGAMNFTYLGCQSANVGTIAGVKTDAGIEGSWAGTIDGSIQSGAYAGSYSAATGSYAGTYTVTGGKQLKVVEGCTQYSIAPQGTWEALPVGGHLPSSFVLSRTGSVVSWTPPAGTVVTLAAVIDEDAALAGTAIAMAYQNMTLAALSSTDITTVQGLVVGRAYVLLVAATDVNNHRLGFASLRFTR